MCDYVIKIGVNGDVTTKRLYTTLSEYARNYLHENRLVITRTLLGYPYVVLINNPAYDLQLSKNIIASKICNQDILGTAIILKIFELAGKNELVLLTEDEAYMLFAYCCRLRDNAEGSKLIDLTGIRYPYYN